MAIDTKPRRHVALADQQVIFPDSPGNLDTPVQRANALGHYYSAVTLPPSVAQPGAGSIDDSLDADFYGGTVSIAGIDSLAGFFVALDGEPYLIDLQHYQQNILDSTTPQTDDAAEPGEKSLSRGGFWARVQTDWSFGAGQDLFDVATSNRARFHESKDTDPWTPNQISLLHATALRRASISNTNLKVYAVGGFLYFVDGDILRYTANPDVEAPTFASTAARPAQITSITSDGNQIFIALGTANAIQAGAINSTTFAAFGTTMPSIVHYANGRLFAATGAEVYELSGTGVKATIKTDPRAGWTWTAIAGMPSAVFFAGAVADVSEIFAVTVDPATGNLLPLVWAGALPYGETVRCMVGYPPAGVVVIGTSKGLRVARVDGQSLAIGERIDIPGGVNAVAVRDRFCWFTWTNPDTSSTGLGRADLSVSTSDVTDVPAYAMDVQASGAQGTVSSVALFGDRAYFSVLGASGGLWAQNQYLVPEGFVRAGRVRYGVLPDKIFTGVEIHHEPLNGKIAAEVEFDDFTTRGLGIGGSQGSVVTVLDDAGGAGLSACLRLSLTRSDGDPTLGPVLHAWVLNAIPRPPRVTEIILPIILRTQLTDLRNRTIAADPLTQYRKLEALASSTSLVLLQFGAASYTVRVAGIAIPEGAVRSWMDDPFGRLGQWVETTAYVRLLSKEA